MALPISDYRQVSLVSSHQMKLPILAAVTLGVLLAMSGCSRATFVMPGESMEPTIHLNEKVTYDPSAYASRAPQRWDVVVLHPLNATDKNMTWAVRVVGLPGEKISFSPGGDILVGGAALQRPAQVASIKFGPGRLTPGETVTVPDNSYYVLGDNTTHAYDSRYWGPLPRANVIGQVIGK